MSSLAKFNILLTGIRYESDYLIQKKCNKSTLKRGTNLGLHRSRRK